jgi:uncharacterized Fe-S cluster-containing radical SAM superfamily protein
MKTDPVSRAEELRRNLVIKEHLLAVDFSGTLQGKDTSKVIELMPNLRDGKLLYRTKINIKEIDPFASKEYGVEFFDTRTKTDAEIEEKVKSADFDFPLWFKHSKGFRMQDILDYNSPFIVQVAGCNFHDGTESGGCWYCFVDDISNDGLASKGKSYVSAQEVLESMVSAQSKLRRNYEQKNFTYNMKVLRISGGEPTIALDWILNLFREADGKRLGIVGQFDTNLSTGHVLENFKRRGIFDKRILEQLAEYPVKVLAAVKGTDDDNLQSNVQASATISSQKDSLIQLVKAGLDIYPQMYNPNPKTLDSFLAEMDKAVENFSLRAHIGPIKLYGPMVKRLGLEAKAKGIDAEKFIDSKMAEWKSNYARACEILNNYLEERYKIGYKKTTRADVRLSVLNS